MTHIQSPLHSSVPLMDLEMICHFASLQAVSAQPNEVIAPLAVLHDDSPVQCEPSSYEGNDYDHVPRRRFHCEFVRWDDDSCEVTEHGR